MGDYFGKERSYLLIILLLLIVVSTGVLASAGLSSWWNTITGKAASDTTEVGLTVASTPPNIIAVQNVTDQDPTDGGYTHVYFLFNATDPDGIDEIDNASAFVDVYKSGETNVTNSTGCIVYGAPPNATTVQYNCSFQMPWYALGTSGGNWTVFVKINDSTDNQDIDASMNFKYTDLNAITSLNVSSISFGSVSVSDTNIQQTAATAIYQNNSGNVVQWTNITAKNLLGYNGASPTTDYMIPASAVKADDVAAACAAGIALSNATAVNITAAASVAKGINSFGVRYLCVTSLWGNLTAQAYNTTGYGSWTLTPTYN